MSGSSVCQDLSVNCAALEEPQSAKVLVKFVQLLRSHSMSTCPECSLAYPLVSGHPTFDWHNGTHSRHLLKQSTTSPKPGDTSVLQPGTPHSVMVA